MKYKCINAANYKVSLTKGKIYNALKTTKKEDSLGFLRIVDDTEEDYLYPREMFKKLESK